MKILQLNIWGGRLGRNISNLLAREAADVLCLQEVVSVPGGGSFFFEDLEEIQEYAGYKHVHHTASGELNFMRRRATFGNAILSRIPFSHTNSLYTYLEKMEDFDFIEDTDYNAGRSLQHVTIEHQDKSLHVLNHHGYHIGTHKNGDKETLRQCGLIADYAKKLEGPVVLCGDFNLVSESPSIELISDVLVNHVKEHGVISTRTPLTHKTEACDYIFTSPDIEVKNFQVLDDIVSDHKALTIEF